MDTNVLKLKACYSREEVPYHTLVINSIDFEYYLWIELPEEIDSTYSLFQLEEIHPNHLNLVIDENSDRIRRDRSRWIRIISQVLGRCYGLHIYRAKFVNKYEDVVSIYFGYIVQDDCPKRPYIYMRRKKRCCCRSGCNLCQ